VPIHDELSPSSTRDAGPPRQVTDPANRDLLESVTRGECPHELEPADRRTKVLVNLARSAEDYQEPEKPRYKAFSGTGRTLTGAVFELAVDSSIQYVLHHSMLLGRNSKSFDCISGSLHQQNILEHLQNLASNFFWLYLCPGRCYSVLCDCGP